MDLKIEEFNAEFLNKPEDGKPKDYRGILSVDQGGDAWLMAVTQDCNDVDLFQNGNLFADNGGEINQSLDVGLYSVRFVPWSSQDFQGEWDGGVNAVDIEPLAVVPKEYLKD